MENVDTSGASEQRSKGRPRLEEAAGIDRAIRQAALEVLFEKGDAATLHAVAQAAGLTRKTVYARYSNKSELFIDAIRQVLLDVGPVTFDRSGTIEDRIAAYLIAVFELLDRPHAQAMQRSLSLNPGPTAELRDELLRASRILFHEPLVEVLADAQACGEIAPDLPPAELARMVMMLAIASKQSPDTKAGDADAIERGSPHHARFIARVISRGVAALATS